MCQVNMYEAKTNFSKLISMLERGEEDEIIVARDGSPIARIVFYENNDTSRRIGLKKDNPIFTKEFEKAFYDADNEIEEMFSA